MGSVCTNDTFANSNNMARQHAGRSGVPGSVSTMGSLRPSPGSVRRSKRFSSDAPRPTFDALEVSSRTSPVRSESRRRCLTRPTFASASPPGGDSSLTKSCSRFSARAPRRATCDEPQGVPAVRHHGRGGRVLRLQRCERHPQGASRGPAASGWTAWRDRPVDVGARRARTLPARGATG